ncbi:MAG TPA: DinB family protein [candidate division Zixibacteria bacterium]|nr:DinB family protein [candidate division Zixibacteria bacterium]
MSEIQRISEQLKCSFNKGAWHGPALLETLDDVTYKQALSHPVSKAHSIWELVLHAAAWIKAVEKTISEMSYTQVENDANWPEINQKTEDDWKKAVDSLKKAHKKLEKLVSTLKDAALERVPANTSSTVYRLLHGVIQHNIYHAGQIAILKKKK